MKNSHKMSLNLGIRPKLAWSSNTCILANFLEKCVKTQAKQSIFNLQRSTTNIEHCCYFSLHNNLWFSK